MISVSEEMNWKGKRHEAQVMWVVLEGQGPGRVL